MPGLAEVSVVITNAQGSNPNRLLVSSATASMRLPAKSSLRCEAFRGCSRQARKRRERSRKGPAKAPVTIVEFSDMQCPHCAKASPQLIDQLLAQEPEAHFVFQNFPLPSHNWAEKAAGYVDCVGRASNDAVWKFIAEDV
jgi:hypothetical protein